MWKDSDKGSGEACDCCESPCGQRLPRQLPLEVDCGPLATPKGGLGATDQRFCKRTLAIQIEGHLAECDISHNPGNALGTFLQTAPFHQDKGSSESECVCQKLKEI